MSSVNYLKNDVVNELHEKGFDMEEIQKMTFEDMVINLYHPSFRLDVENKYSKPVLYSSGKVVNNDISYMYTLPNGTLVVTDPRVTKYIERSIRNLVTEQHLEPWKYDTECIEYENEILKRREADV